MIKYSIVKTKVIPKSILPILLHLQRKKDILQFTDLPDTSLLKWSNTASPTVEQTNLRCLSSGALRLIDNALVEASVCLKSILSREKR